MKKAIVLVSIVMLVFSGCDNSTLPAKQYDSSISESSNVDTIQEDELQQDIPVGKNWTKEEIQSLFIKANQNYVRNFTIIDAVVIPDFAYNRVGAVLYVDNEKQTSNVAFLDSEGNYQTSGAFANLCTDSEFTYCGNGMVSFKIQTETGSSEIFKLSLSIDGPNVNFVVSDDHEKENQSN